jgi:hypothetical protein
MLTTDIDAPFSVESPLRATVRSQVQRIPHRSIRSWLRYLHATSTPPGAALQTRFHCLVDTPAQPHYTHP